MPAKKNRSRRDTALLGHLDNGLSSEERTAGTAKGTVGSNVNALLLAEVDNLLLRQGGVILDLVGGRDDCYLGQKLLQILDTVVGDTDGLDFARTDQLLHVLIGGDMAVAVDDVPAAISQLGENVVVTWLL